LTAHFVFLRVEAMGEHNSTEQSVNLRHPNLSAEAGYAEPAETGADPGGWEADWIDLGGEG
jgi:hypothetical protein